MHALNFDIQNIAAGQGSDLAITGMAIVFVALTLISLFIRCLPRTLELVGRLFPTAAEAHADASVGVAEATDRIAAIGFALHKEAVS
jgi:Na+-transporting methylmalonyl-CoA/oxaloacetate decarboxylase gamma subunit